MNSCAFPNQRGLSVCLHENVTPACLPVYPRTASLTACTVHIHVYVYVYMYAYLV